MPRVGGVSIRIDVTTGRSQRSLQNLQRHLRDAGFEVRNLQGEMERGRQASVKFGDGIQALGGALASLGIGKAVKEATLLAARTENLGTVLANVGAIAGETSGSLALIEESTKNLGITTRQARRAITLLAQAELDLANSANLARIAQDAAVIAGINSSDAFERLVVAIQRNDTRLLRNLGIVVNLNQVYAKFAAQTGRSAQSLSAFEKRQILYNEVVEKGKIIQGTYEVALGDVFKRLTSMDRLVEEASRTFGNQFIPVLEVAVDKTSEFLKFFAGSEGASLRVFTGQMATFAITLGGIAAAFGTARLAAIAFGGVLSPGGLLAVGIALLISQLQAANARLVEARQRMEDLGTAGAAAGARTASQLDVVTTINRLIDDVNNFGEASTQGAKAVALLESSLRELGQLTGEEGAVERILAVDNFENRVSQIEKLIKAHGLEMTASERLAQLRKAEAVAVGVLGENLTNLERVLDSVNRSTDTTGTTLLRVGRNTLRLSSEYDKLRKIIKDVDGDFSKLVDNVGNLNPELVDSLDNLRNIIKASGTFDEAFAGKFPIPGFDEALPSPARTIEALLKSAGGFAEDLGGLLGSAIDVAEDLGKEFQENLPGGLDRTTAATLHSADAVQFLAKNYRALKIELTAIVAREFVRLTREMEAQIALIGDIQKRLETILNKEFRGTVVEIVRENASALKQITETGFQSVEEILTKGEAFRETELTKAGEDFEKLRELARKQIKDEAELTRTLTQIDLDEERRRIAINRDADEQIRQNKETLFNKEEAINNSRRLAEERLKEIIEETAALRIQTSEVQSNVDQRLLNLNKEIASVQNEAARVQNQLIKERFNVQQDLIEGAGRLSRAEVLALESQLGVIEQAIKAHDQFRFERERLSQAKITQIQEEAQRKREEEEARARERIEDQLESLAASALSTQVQGRRNFRFDTLFADLSRRSQFIVRGLSDITSAFQRFRDLTRTASADLIGPLRERFKAELAGIVQSQTDALESAKQKLADFEFDFVDRVRSINKEVNDERERLIEAGVDEERASERAEALRERELGKLEDEKTALEDDVFQREKGLTELKDRQVEIEERLLEIGEQRIANLDTELKLFRERFQLEDVGGIGAGMTNVPDEFVGREGGFRTFRQDSPFGRNQSFDPTQELPFGPPPEHVADIEKAMEATKGTNEGADEFFKEFAGQSEVLQSIFKLLVEGSAKTSKFILDEARKADRAFSRFDKVR